MQFWFSYGHIIKPGMQPDETCTRFRTQLTKNKLKNLVYNQGMSKTESSMKLAVFASENWRENRAEHIPALHVIVFQTMAYRLERFLLEMRKITGQKIGISDFMGRSRGYDKASHSDM